MYLIRLHLFYKKVFSLKKFKIPFTSWIITLKAFFLMKNVFIKVNMDFFANFLDFYYKIFSGGWNTFRKVINTFLQLILHIFEGAINWLKGCYIYY